VCLVLTNVDATAQTPSPARNPQGLGVGWPRYLLSYSGNMALMDEAEADVLAFMSFPNGHRPKIRSTNPLERVLYFFGAVCEFLNARLRAPPRDAPII